MTEHVARATRWAAKYDRLVRDIDQIGERIAELRAWIDEREARTQEDRT